MESLSLRRNVFGPIREWARKPAEYKESGVVIEAPTLTFTTQEQAQKWADINAEDSCFFFHRWEVVSLGRRFAIGVFNLNTGERDGWAE